MFLKILYLGDIVGRAGRLAVKENLASLVKENSVDLVFANGENASGGAGLAKKEAKELFSYGIDYITLGDHTWDRADIVETFNEANCKVIRPLNYNPNLAGKGYLNIEYKNKKITLVNLLGRVFTGALVECPFKTFQDLISQEKSDFYFVDLHAEATSEKYAFFRHFSNDCSIIVGTHTHVQTADERIEDKTGYITDLGMCGGTTGVIGVKKEGPIRRFIYGDKARFSPDETNPKLSGVLASFDESGQCKSIKRI